MRTQKGVEEKNAKHKWSQKNGKHGTWMLFLGFINQNKAKKTKNPAYFGKGVIVSYFIEILELFSFLG